jgi:16S rRNA (uracil1498-N3)-methyltransferase
MSRERFFIEQAPSDSTVRLADAEAHHARDVRRLAVGDEVELFDGAGTDYDAHVTSCDRHGVTVQITGSRPGGREPGVAVTLAVAVVKSGSMDQLIDTCTQLGVRQIVLLRTERRVVDPRSGKLDRWRRIAITACKQSGRSVVPQIDGVVKFDDLLGRVDDYDLAVVAATRTDAAPLVKVVGGARKNVLCLIGPEGGFTDEEEQAAISAGCRPVSLGRPILRAETAAAAALAVICQAASPQQQQGDVSNS